MGKGVNRVILVGNIGADPEVKFMPSGGAVCNLTLATSDSWKDKTTGERVERTEWSRIVMFNKTAEIAGQYLRKGSQIYVEGSLRTRKWDKDGVDMYTTEIVVSDMQMLGSKGDSSSGGQQQQKHESNAAPQQNQADNAFDADEDSIPF